MAIWGEASFSSTKNLSRLDAEFFQPDFLENERILLQMGARPLDTFLRDIRYGLNVPPVYSDRGIPFYRASNLKEYGIDGEVLNIPYRITEIGAINILSEGDVLIVRSGANVGDSGIVFKGMEGATFGSYTIRLRLSEIDPYYYYAFLRCRFGRLQTIRFRSGAAQPNMSIPNLRQLLVFRPSEKRIEESIRNKVLHSRQSMLESEVLYTRAERMLLTELGLEELDLSPTLFYERSYFESRAAARLDAEFFQPTYRRVFEALKSTKPKRIAPLDEFLALLTNGHTPRQHDLSEGDVPFLTAEHVFDFRIDYDSEKRILREHHDGELKRTRLKKGDCLITIKGRIGNAAIAEDFTGPVNINQDVALFRLKEGMPPYFLMAYLNSQAGQAFSRQYCTGQINPFLGLGNVRQLPVPVYDDRRMERIAAKTEQTVLKARAARDESRRLLEEAKRTVEAAVLGDSVDPK